MYKSISTFRCAILWANEDILLSGNFIVVEDKFWKNYLQYHISSLFSIAYVKAAITADAKSGFRKTGIWPVKADIFEFFLCVPTQTTNRPIPDTTTQDRVRMPHVVLLHLQLLRKVK
jgi:hypothetical protein